MSEFRAVTLLVEGQTEQLFVREVLAEYGRTRGLWITPIVLSKKGQKGGDVRFARAKRDIALHLKQRQDSVVSLLVDYYGLGQDWPGKEKVAANASPAQVAATIGAATSETVRASLGDAASRRFVPNIVVHEFEALLFSDPEVLARHLSIDPTKIEQILAECGQPEAIDDSPRTAPSKRLRDLAGGHFRKTATGVAAAREIGIARIRAQCPVFDAWLGRLEAGHSR